MGIFLKTTSILSLFLLLSCGVKKTSIHYGETTRADLIQLVGEPQKEEKIPVRDSSIMVYPDKTTYQIKNGVVVATLKEPIKSEENIIFWRHKLKDCSTNLVKVQSKDSHTPPQMELNCDAEGIKVVYIEGVDPVLKVVEYARK